MHERPPRPAYLVHRYSMFGQHLIIRVKSFRYTAQNITLLELNARHALLHLFSFSDHPNTVPRHSKPFEFYCRRYEMAAAWFKLKQGAIKVLISTQPFKCRNKTNQIQTDSTKGFGL